MTILLYTVISWEANASNKSIPLARIHAPAHLGPYHLDHWLWTLTFDYGLCFGSGILVSVLHLVNF